MSVSKIPSGGPPSQSELPRCSREFVQEASKLHRAGLSKETVLQILKHSGAVFEFVKIAGLIRVIGVDDYVMENLISSIWEEDHEQS
jgi:hypothetical protein